ncbi:CDP-alcohol phosphatidyltransferase family protein [Pseudokineococcus sp. 5B2Z-1]|uniref:CDP-alcohol phosphatidyltransferase family protein n=1 Tax=Pseudokineococcus sp. 5B2Z-1 TaxID=3132744 RepID=UPI0030B52736
MTQGTASPPRESYREVVARLSAAQKSGRGAPAYSRFVNRPLGRRLAAAAYLAGATPNAVTAASGACSFAGIAVLALSPRGWLVGVVVAALLVLGYALDAADGQLARLRGGGSPSGEWLDHMVDCAKISALHLAVLVSTYRASRAGDLDVLWCLLPLAFTVVASTAFFAQILNEQLRRAHGVESARLAQGSSPLRSLLAAPTDYGLLCLVFLLLGSSVLFTAGYGVLLLGSAGYLALALVKWYREMGALGRRP